MPDEKLARAIRSRTRRDILHKLHKKVHKKGATSVNDIAERLMIK